MKHNHMKYKSKRYLAAFIHSQLDKKLLPNSNGSFKEKNESKPHKAMKNYK